MVPSLSISCHELASVGVGFNASGNRIGSGDMVGQIWVTEKDQVAPLHKVSVSLVAHGIVTQ